MLEIDLVRVIRVQSQEQIQFMTDTRVVEKRKEMQCQIAVFYICHPVVEQAYRIGSVFVRSAYVTVFGSLADYRRFGKYAVHPVYLHGLAVNLPVHIVRHVGFRVVHESADFLFPVRMAAVPVRPQLLLLVQLQVEIFLFPVGHGFHSDDGIGHDQGIVIIVIIVEA